MHEVSSYRAFFETNPHCKEKDINDNNININVDDKTNSQRPDETLSLSNDEYISNNNTNIYISDI